MVIELAILRYRNPDGSVNYALYFGDCVDRIRQTFTGLDSFDELCTLVRTTMAKWHKPRFKPPANLDIVVRDEGDHPQEARKLETVPGATVLYFEPNEKRHLLLVAVTATADAVAI